MNFVVELFAPRRAKPDISHILSLCTTTRIKHNYFEHKKNLLSNKLVDMKLERSERA